MKSSRCVCIGILFLGLSFVLASAMSAEQLTNSQTTLGLIRNLSNSSKQVRVESAYPLIIGVGYDGYNTPQKSDSRIR